MRGKVNRMEKTAEQGRCVWQRPCKQLKIGFDDRSALHVPAQESGNGLGQLVLRVSGGGGSLRGNE